MFHYSVCGLNHIWLENGFEIVETDYGEGVKIHNIPGLHRAIALDLCKQEDALTGAQFRFLRIEMNLSQPELAELLGVKTLTVSNYEKGKGKRGIPKSIDALMRSMYLEHIKKGSPVTRMLKQIADLNSREAASSFNFNRGRWFSGDAKATGRLATQAT